MTVQVPEQMSDVTDELTPSDRCDSCGAQAYMRATLPNGGQLLFCGHHGRKNFDTLSGLGATWLDESGRLDPARNVSPVT